MAKQATVIGAGPVGCVLALLLRKRGYEVVVFEKRSDMRLSETAAGRSINLVLTPRGLRALDLLGLRDEVRALTVPVYGRMMHSLEGELAYQPYGKDEREFNDSIGRGELNRFLLDKAEAAGVTLHFEAGLERLDLEAGVLHFADGREVEAQVVFGADGAPSAVRESLAAAGKCERTLDMLPDGYKELLFPADEEGGYRMDPKALHIWPRGDHFLMGLPNQDGSFTGTVYMPNEGPLSFAALDTPAKVEAFFAEHYPDSVEVIGPTLSEQWFANPRGHLGTVRSYPWRLEDRVLLVGDSAHGIVPFFGQGLNCGFEDCAVLEALFNEHGDEDLGVVFRAYEEARKPAGDAIADMALENYVEMRAKVADPAFLLRKKVQKRLEGALAPRYRSRYAMVVYSSIPYHLAQQAGAIEAEILDELCAGISGPEQVDLARAEELVAAKLAPFVAEHGLDLDF